VASEKLQDKTVCVVGLGYVGLPLAEAFSEHLRTIGYRRDQQKVDALNTVLKIIDRTMAEKAGI
jgi:UDPglucose 6-dehydrogenase/UDP-N-acetyl-D-galactosamine dehydrogenase